MSKPQVVVTRRIPDEAIDAIRAACDVRYWDDDEAIPRDTLLEWVHNGGAGIDGLYCLLTEQINQELLEAAGDSLRVVSTMSVGYDHVDVDACTARDVAVGNTPGVLTDTTADLALALLLATARRLTEAAAAIQAGEWATWKPMWLTGRDLTGSTVGIVGLGDIGTAFARRLAGFDCRILYSGPREKPENAGAVGAEHVGFETLLAESDFVSMHAPLNDATRELFNADVFGQMKSTAIFINTSRGGTVDQEALVDALRGGEIAGAGLDVTTPEPLPSDHPLLSLPNCVVLPHIGSASIATRTKMATMAAENLLAGVRGKPLVSRVN